MNTVIIGRKCTPKDSFKERAEQKLGKIDKLFGGEGDAKITCSVIKNKATVELTIHNNGMFYRTQATADDMSDALDQCIDMMIRKIRRNKTKLSKKLKAGTLTTISGTHRWKRSWNMTWSAIKRPPSSPRPWMRPFCR